MTLTEEELRDKIYACWEGKNIGGTLGGPTEGRMEWLHLEKLEGIGNDPLPNDDLDLQLVNLHAVEQRGLNITTQDLSKEWLEHVRFPYDEYGYALTNLRKGLVPPLSGYFENPFVDCMGSPIRSELWAVLAPGKPAIASYLAYQDAMVDHAGGEGVYAEMYNAVLESLAFEESDRETLIEKAVAFLPAGCVTAKVIRDTLKWYREGVSYTDIRDLILKSCGSDNFTYAPQNMAFITVGLLYGSDFGDCLLKAVNMGYDTDCTGATTGAICGILWGRKGIPAAWREPVSERIAVSKEIVGLDWPRTISELTRRSMILQQQLAPEAEEDFLFIPMTDFDRQIFCLPQGASFTRSLRVTLKTKETPVPGQKLTIFCVLKNRTHDRWQASVSCRENNWTSPVMDLEDQSTVPVQFEVTVPEEAAEREEALAKSVKEDRIPKTMTLHLTVARYEQGGLWVRYPIEFTLPVGSRWSVDGQTVYTKGQEVVLKGEGLHKITTTLTVPSDRPMRLIAACSQPVRVRIRPDQTDGRPVVNDPDEEVYMPAYHRAPKEQTAELELKAGKYQVDIQVDSRAEETRLSLMPCAPREDFCMMYIDCAIG